MNDTIRIQSVADLEPSLVAEACAGAEAVFWETAPDARDLQGRDRRRFLRKYFTYYLEVEPELFLVAFDEACGGEGVPVRDEPVTHPAVLGYICAVADTRCHPELYALADHLAIFDDLYDLFPAHLHINLTAASRGRGVGSRLIGELEQRLRQAGTPGLHLVTTVGKRNVRFYERNGFTRQFPRPQGDHSPGAGAQGSRSEIPLLMGKHLVVGPVPER